MPSPAGGGWLQIPPLGPMEGVGPARQGEDGAEFERVVGQRNGSALLDQEERTDLGTTRRQDDVLWHQRDKDYEYAHEDDYEVEEKCGFGFQV